MLSGKWLKSLDSQKPAFLWAPFIANAFLLMTDNTLDMLMGICRFIPYIDQHEAHT